MYNLMTPKLLDCVLIGIWAKYGDYVNTLMVKNVSYQGLKLSLGLNHPVGQVVSNCYSPLIMLYSSLVLHLVLKLDRSIKSWAQLFKN